MRKLIFEIIALISSTLIWANGSAGLKSYSDGLIFKLVKIPCTVTVSQVENGFEFNCTEQKTELITVFGSCTKTAENCDIAYTQARSCALSDASTKLANAKEEVAKTCLDDSTF